MKDFQEIAFTILFLHLGDLLSGSSFSHVCTSIASSVSVALMNHDQSQYTYLFLVVSCNFKIDESSLVMDNWFKHGPCLLKYNNLYIVLMDRNKLLVSLGVI